MRNTAKAFTCLCCGVFAACWPDSERSSQREAPVAQVTTPTTEEELTAFTAGLDERPARLGGGASSLEGLAERFVRTIQERDTASVRSIHISRAEFAYLVYPTHPQAQPPYSLPPAVMWMMMEAASAKAVQKAFSLLGEQKAQVEDVACEDVLAQGQNRFHSGCVALARVSPGREALRFPLGLIVERDGQFKFVSYAGRL